MKMKLSKERMLEMARKLAKMDFCQEQKVFYENVLELLQADAEGRLLMNMNILDFMNCMKEFDVTLDYVFSYSDRSEIDEEYSFEGKGNEYEEAMKGYDFQFDLCLADFAEINIDVAKKSCKLVYVTLGIEN